jgi:Tfp pilus assembly protein PilO
VKGSDKAIVMGVVVAVVLAGFYFKVLAPKREKASSLSKDITELQAKVDQQKQAANFAEDARRQFPTYYGRLVVLGKAVPADADTSSLLVELSSVATRTDVKFDSLTLTASSGDSSTASPAAAATSTASTAGTSSSPSGTSTTGTSTTSASGTTATTSSTTSTVGATTPAAATESAAANLPLGASVGAAGLPTMPYDLSFEGSYFDVANFLKRVDDLVHLRGSFGVAADGRLLTIDGFSLTPKDGSNPSSPTLDVKLAVTSFVTPSDQGLTAGATPGGPAPSLSQPQAQPASAAVTP